MVSLVEAADGLIAYPSGKGSGAITSFAQADGFLKVDALADQMPAGSETEVTLFTPHVRVPDLVIVGSHCTGLDLVTAPLARAGLIVRSIAVGSLGGLAAAKRGECDLAPIHLFDEKSEDLQHAVSWRRARTGCGLAADAGHRVSQRRHPVRRTKRRRRGARGAGRSRLHHGQPQPGCGYPHPDRPLLGGARPDGYWNQPRSHNAVAAAVAQHRADWGMTIAPVAHAAGLGFIPLAEEHYDFALVTARKPRPAVQAFLEALASAESRAALTQAGFRPD